MKVTIHVETREQSIARAVTAATSGRETDTAYITFPTVEQLFKTLTDSRWQILLKMTGAGPMSIRRSRAASLRMPP